MDFALPSGAHDTAESSSERCIPKNGYYADEPVTSSGFLAFTVSGAQLWHYNTSQDKNALELEEFDSCGGHASPTNKYHYHGVTINFLPTSNLRSR